MYYMTTSITLVPKRLVDKRKAAGLSQDGLAALVRKRLDDETFHQTNISGYERGTKTPSLPVFRALAQVLETNMEWLAGETDDDKPSSDLEDQVIVGVPDPARRVQLQAAAQLLAASGDEDFTTLMWIIRRVLAGRVERGPSHAEAALDFADRLAEGEQKQQGNATNMRQKRVGW